MLHKHDYMFQVLRSYDDRLSKLDRNCEVYFNKDCRSIVADGEGHGTREVIKFYEQLNTALDDTVLAADVDEFWKPSCNKTLLVIAVPHREGEHVAKHPISFIPIIDQLEKLHEAGFVHGDIRAFNTIFGATKEDKGYLIDFDFSGIPGTLYPPGYKKSLDDGQRFTGEDNKMQKWHDWYALGRLIFVIHEFCVPNDGIDPELDKNYTKLLRFWMNIKEPEPDNMDKLREMYKIDELREMLKKLDEAGIEVQPSKVFNLELTTMRKIDNDQAHQTHVGATGSPPK